MRGEVLELIRCDFARYGIKDVSGRLLLKKLFSDSILRYLVWHRLGHYYFMRGNRAMLRLLGVLRRLGLVRSHNSEIPFSVEFGPGLYIGHFTGITINPDVRFGKNINLHKGVTVGQQNRGKRKGVPTIGNDVYIGINSVVAGHIVIGDNVLIAPNSHVNCDVPANSVVYGNPPVIRRSPTATEFYINNRC